MPRVSTRKLLTFVVYLVCQGSFSYELWHSSLCSFSSLTNFNCEFLHNCVFSFLTSHPFFTQMNCVYVSFVFKFLRSLHKLFVVYLFSSAILFSILGTYIFHDLKQLNYYTSKFHQSLYSNVFLRLSRFL